MIQLIHGLKIKLKFLIFHECLNFMLLIFEKKMDIYIFHIKFQVWKCWNKEVLRSLSSSHCPLQKHANTNWSWHAYKNSRRRDLSTFSTLSLLIPTNNTPWRPLSAFRHQCLPHVILYGWFIPPVVSRRFVKLKLIDSFRYKNLILDT